VQRRSDEEPRAALGFFRFPEAFEVFDPSTPTTAALTRLQPTDVIVDRVASGADCGIWNAGFRARDCSKLRPAATRASNV
jgi:hypothetical protein